MPRPHRADRGREPTDKVLVVTGGLLSITETSPLRALERQFTVLRAGSGIWLEVQLKLHLLQDVLTARGYRKTRKYRHAPYRAAVDRFFTDTDDLQSPELTEVALLTLLETEGMPFEVATYAELASDDVRRERLLRECACVFASTTLIRDRSELDPLIAMLKRPGNHVVAGGALAGVLHHEWAGHPDLDVLAIGYGELLIPALAKWIRSGYRELERPPSGRVVEKGGNLLLYSGVPATTNLDFLPRPDWSLAERAHGRPYRLVRYESVRGCPYRCGFCNYPYLFDDTKFRYKSAERIVEDWAAYAAAGAEYVSCLDSLFTMPRRRLVAVCEGLLERGIRLKWICYARADDLCDRSTVELMKLAGCIEVAIGIESGDQGQLDNMDKRCTVEKNALALRTCRDVGIASLVTVIFGYPGDTPAAIRNTYAFLASSPPDFFFAAPFNARVEHVPVLRQENRERFGIELASDPHSSQPYWRHDTMSCVDVADHVRWMNREMIRNRVSLHRGVFFGGPAAYEIADRDALLDFQRDAIAASEKIGRLVEPVHRWAGRKLRDDVERKLGPWTPGMRRARTALSVVV